MYYGLSHYLTFSTGIEKGYFSDFQLEGAMTVASFIRSVS